MKRLAIDFAPASPARTLALAHPLAIAAIMLALAASIGAAWQLGELDAARADLAARTRDARHQVARAAARSRPVPEVPIPEPQAAPVGRAVAQLNLPWRDLFEALEASTPKTIALLALEPDAKKQVLKGTAEAQTSEGMIAYIEELKQHPFFSFVALTKHETNLQDPNKPIRFQFEAEWNPQRGAP